MPRPNWHGHNTGRKMADKISDDDRRLIDEAIAAGKVTVVPTGVSGIPEEPMGWREAVDRQFKMLKRGDRIRNAPYARSVQSIAVDKQIRSLLSEGKSNSQIAKAMNLTVGAVQQRLFRMGVTRGQPKRGDNVPFGE